MRLSSSRRLGLQLVALLGVAAAVLLGSAGPADAAAMSGTNRTINNWDNGAGCLYEAPNIPSDVFVSLDGSSCYNYRTWRGASDWTIRNKATGYCLTARPASGTSSGVYAALCNGSGYQKWSTGEQSPGRIVYHNLGNNWYLAVNLSDDTVITAPLNTTYGQVWYECYATSGTDCGPLPN